MNTRRVNKTERQTNKKDKKTDENPLERKKIRQTKNRQRVTHRNIIGYKK